MKTLIIYDSSFGNTEKVAQAMAAAIGGEVRHATEVDPAALPDYDLLIIGSPTHGGYPTEHVHKLLRVASDLNGVRAAVFDTRAKESPFGYAAPRMAQAVEKHGCQLLGQPAGFVVVGLDGPLVDGELERAIAWAEDVRAAA